jgi:polysaccharide export outer membrane protein
MRQICSSIIIACTLFFASCSTLQKTVYFSDNAPVSEPVQVMKMDKYKEPIIQTDDIVAINVTTISSLSDKNPVSIFNDGGTSYSITATIGGTGGGAGGGLNNFAYRVDADGYIDYPVLGKIKMSNLTIRQAKELLALKLKDYVKDPVVEVRIINYKVTILGEVSHPGIIVAPNQKISIIDAIAAAGDIPITGRKDNVEIIRETEGNREIARVNLTSKNIFNSPYYYLKQNDIVYVEPMRIRKHQNNEFVQFYLPTITSLLSTVLAVYGITQIAK